MLGNAALPCLPGSPVLSLLPPGPWHEHLFLLSSCAQHPAFLRRMEQGWDSCSGMGAPSAWTALPGDCHVTVLMSLSPFPASPTLTFPFSPFPGSSSVPAPSAVCSQARLECGIAFPLAADLGVQPCPGTQLRAGGQQWALQTGRLLKDPGASAAHS